MSATTRVVVVEFDGADVLPRCLTSLARALPASVPITLLDNAFPAKAENLIPLDLRDRIELHQMGRNVGYAGAIAEAWSIGDEKYLIIANNDIEFIPGWFEALIETAESTGAHAVSAAIEHEGDTEIERTSNASLNPLLYLIPGVFADRTKAVYPSGACFLLRRDGDLPRTPVDPDYFLYYEDVYIGFMLRAIGKTVVQCPDARVRHVGSHAVKKANPNLVAFLQERNRWMTQLLFLDVATLFAIAPHTFFDWLFRIPACWIRRKPSFATIWAHWWVWFHIGSILRKRGQLRKLRDFDPRRILPYLTGKVLPGSSAFARGLNAFSTSWLRLTGVPVDEEARR